MIATAYWIQFCAALILAIPLSAGAQAKELSGVVQSVSADGTQLTLFETTASGCPETLSAVKLSITAPALKDQLKVWKRCDRIRVSFDDAGAVSGLLPQVREVGLLWRILALFLAALLLFGVTALLTSFSPIRMLLVGTDNRYSNSKTQATIWLGLVLSSYLAAIALRIATGQWNWGVDVPKNLLMLAGLSGISFGTAKGITTKKVADADAAHNVNPNVLVKTTASKPRFPLDLLQDDNSKFDFGDYQMILITAIAAVSYLLLIVRFLGTVQMYSGVSLPDVDTTILSLFGVGQGAYLVKKSISGINN